MTAEVDGLIERLGELYLKTGAPSYKEGADALSRLQRELQEQQQRVVEGLRKDAEAIALYYRTAKAHGFYDVCPNWHELSEQTRELYREEWARKNEAAVKEKQDG